MKIIFDDERQMKRLISNHCPTEICNKAQEDIYCASTLGRDVCERCWKYSGIELEVKE